jgi:tetratricopeptide (TPR) repeat protein
MESTRHGLRTALWLAALIGAAGGCRRESALTWCPEGDLGAFRLESRTLLPAPEQGCEARYLDPQGRAASARVRAFRPGRFSQAPPPRPFEKHLVHAWPEGDLWRVGWTAEGVTVELGLEGVEGPEGPVLRGLLFHHPSTLAEEVEARERDVALLRQESRELPRDARIHLDLARNYRKLGNTLMAAQEYHIAVELDRGCYACYLELGGLYRELRQWDLAIRALRRASALGPAEPAAWLALGDVCYQVRGRAEAMAAYQRALGLALEEEDRRRVEERLGALEKGEFMLQILPRALSPDDPPPAEPDDSR